MAIESATSTQNSGAVQTVSQPKVSSTDTKSVDSSASSFKEEMDKAASEDKKSELAKTKSENQDNKSCKNPKSDEVDSKAENLNSQDNLSGTPAQDIAGALGANNSLAARFDKNSKTSAFDENDNCRALADNIGLMMSVNSIQEDSNFVQNSFRSEKILDSDFRIGDSKSANKLSISAQDAEFFVDLTNSVNGAREITVQNISSHAENIINNGGNEAVTNSSAKVSEALLNALNMAKENNQPLRIDFDNNMAVILRVNRDGVISANFIPGDKAVEQYLRNNIEQLKNSFEENNLPYNDLSYSNSSKEQNQRRRNQKQQGE